MSCDIVNFVMSRVNIKILRSQKSGEIKARENEKIGTAGLFDLSKFSFSYFKSPLPFLTTEYVILSSQHQIFAAQKSLHSC